MLCCIADVQEGRLFYCHKKIAKEEFTWGLGPGAFYTLLEKKSPTTSTAIFIFAKLKKDFELQPQSFGD